MSLDFLRSLFDSKGVSLKAKNGLYTLGAGLPDDEVAYLATAIKHALG
ncbi:MAG TPA: hypothetical protein VGL77_12445 [Armatimonadota bacterium]|jgi:hypothetical protein